MNDKFKRPRTGPIHSAPRAGLRGDAPTQGPQTSPEKKRRRPNVLMELVAASALVSLSSLVALRQGLQDDLVTALALVGFAGGLVVWMTYLLIRQGRREATRQAPEA